MSALARAAAGLSGPRARSGTALDDLPEIEQDGVTLRFSSIGQYQAQHRRNIAHGGLIARSAPLPLGTHKLLGLMIPGRGRYNLTARVTFVGDGTVGFTIDSFATHRENLRAFAE